MSAALAVFAIPLTLAAQEQADSSRTRVLERLQVLSRPPVPDSLVALLDSLSTPGRGRQPTAQRGGSSADSVLTELLALPGYSATRYEADRADFEAESRNLTLLGAEGRRASFIREGQQVSADSAITFNNDTGRGRAMGNPIYAPETGDPVESEVLIFDMNEDRASALGASTQYPNGGATWFVRADFNSVTSEHVFGTHARFTSDEGEDPSYHFRANELKIVNDKVLVARPVTLYFKDVPVLWLPFIAQGLGSGRSSGILTPRFSINDIVRTSRGYRRRISNVGFYWAMSDYSDAQVAMDWFSGEFFSMTGSVRYNWMRKFLRGSVNFREYWRDGGGREIAFDTRHDWAISERTQFRTSARFASSTDFVRRNSFDPREITQSINSDGGINRRFDWGSLSLSANRRQFLSDDRVETTFPSANLSLRPITFFSAPPNRARWFNNITWSGSGNWTRRVNDRADQPDSAFVESQADKQTTTAGLSSSLSLGSFSWSQGLRTTNNVIRDVPLIGDTLSTEANMNRLVDDFLGRAGQAETPRRDLGDMNIAWNTSFNYQQRLIGTTTITPSLQISGNYLRSDKLADSIPEASSLVAGPSRLSFGATLKTDMYGFFPGFAGFSAIRHKLSPSFTYNYTPATTPSDLQRQVFGSRELQPRNELRIGISQTFEAKREEDEEGEGEEGADETSDPAATGTGPQRQQTAQIVNLLSLRTSAVTYDFVQADSAGDWKSGFTTTRLSNQVSSDFLRGLTLSMEHDLFDTSEGTGPKERKFAPHLSQLNFSFQLGSRSGIVRVLGRLLGGGEPPAEGDEPEEEEDTEEQMAGITGAEESTIIPGEDLRNSRAGGRSQRSLRSQSGGSGQWNANIQYSLRRPRGDAAVKNQMVQGTVTFSPTESWDVSWRTAYDVEVGAFNDHIVSITRNLGRWEANFDFLQTATGNWTFRFLVFLRDLRDLKMDYEQRNLQDTSLTRRSRF